MPNLLRNYFKSAGIIYVAIAVVLLLGCEAESEMSRVDSTNSIASKQTPTRQRTERVQDPREQEQRAEEVDTDPTGVYVFESREYVIKLRVMGTTWMATTTPVTGFGEDYDTEQTEVSTGSVQGTDLYEETGYIKVGELYRIGSRWSASMLFAGGSVTLVKR